MGQREQRHRVAAGGPFALGGEQGLEGAAVGVAREQLVAVDEVAQGHGLAPQRVDHMPVVDDVAVAAVRPRPAARQRHERRRAEEHRQAVVVEAHRELMADKAGGHGVEHPAQDEAAGGGDAHADGVEVVGAARRQRREGGPLGVDADAQPGVAAGDHLGDEGPVVGQGVEVGRAAQQQGVPEGALEVAVRALDGAVLVRLAAVVAGRRHAVVRA